MDDVITQLYTLSEIRVGDKLCVGSYGELSIDRAGATQVLWRSIRRDCRIHTINVINALCIRVQMAVLDATNTNTTNASAITADHEDEKPSDGGSVSTLRAACIAALAGLRTLSQTYKIGEVDDATAESIMRVVSVLTHTCCCEPKALKASVSTWTQTQAQTQTQTQTPPPPVVSAVGTGMPRLPLSPPTSTVPPAPKMPAPQHQTLFNRSWRKRGAGTAVTGNLPDLSASIVSRCSETVGPPVPPQTATDVVVAPTDAVHPHPSVRPE
jgi:hypothetical protein